MSEAQALHDISGKLGRLEALQEANAKAQQELTTSVNRLVDKLDRSDDIAREAAQSARSAHHRIDELKRDDIKPLADNQTWLWRTALGGVVLGAIGLLFAFLKGGVHP